MSKTEQQTVQIALANLQEGDWIEFEYGFDSKIFYVIHNDVSRGRVRVGRRGWLASSTVTVTYEELERSYNYIGRGKMKWYWRFLPWRAVVCPFTSVVWWG